MNVAVTGPGGFIGSTLVPELRARGHPAIALGRAAIGDVATFRDWTRVLDGADAVVHLAGYAHGGAADEARLRNVGVDATLALGKAIAAKGLRMIYLSSVKVLGEETPLAPFGPESPLAPSDVYARAKADAEIGLREIQELRLTILRPPLVYGPGVKANFLALMRLVARGWPLPLASIENRRSLVYVGNLADAIVRCIESPAAEGKTYLVSDGAPVSTPELCRALARALGRTARLFPFPPVLLELVPALRKLTRSLEVDDRAIHSELGWVPPFAFEQGIRLTAQWYLARR